MRFKGVAIKLGIFAAITGAVTVMLAAVIGNFAPFRDRYPVAAVFEDATGLLKGDPVTLAGVTIGKVEGSHVEDGMAVVDMAVDEAVRLPRETRVEIRYRNLIGLRVVNLEAGDGSGPFLEPGDRIPASQTQGPLDLDDVFNNLRPLLTGISGDDINTISDAIVVSLARHKGDIDAVLADTATFLGALAGKDAELGRLIDNMATLATGVAGEREQLDRLLSNFASLAGSLAGDSSELDRVLVNLNAATRDLGRLIADNRGSLERDLDDLATVLELVVEHQADLEQVATNLDDVLRASLKAMSYGEWANLYVPAFCLTLTPGCENALATTTAASPRSLEDLLSYGTRAGR